MSNTDAGDAAVAGVLINWHQNIGDVDQVEPNMEAENDSAHTDLSVIPAPVSPWTWSGIHFLESTSRSRRIHPFLANHEDPRLLSTSITMSMQPTEHLLTGAGGLLVLMVKPARPNPEPAGPSTNLALSTDQNWHPILVCNPLSHERRVLPSADCRDVGWTSWEYRDVIIHFVVDEQTRTYKLSLTFPTCFCIYRSSSNRWRCKRFPQPGPWETPHETTHQPDIHDWAGHIVCGSVSMGGRLFLGDVEPEPGTCMRLFEIDPEAGVWKRLNWTYSLQSRYWDFLQTPVLRNRGLMDRNRALRDCCNRGHDKRVLRYLELVECIGDLYAVIPARLDEYLLMSFTSLRTLVEVVHEYPNFGLEFMPLQFLIVQLRGDGFVHGVLRILVPDNLDRQCFGEGCDDVGNQRRKQSLFDNIGQEHDPNNLEPEADKYWDFNCTAEGSVIWVAMDDYMLQYDVVTGRSKTQIIVEGIEGVEVDQFLAVIGVPYRPSNMRP